MEYEPGGHKSQLARFCVEREPALQFMQLSCVDEATESENLPASQRRHVCGPASVLYLPARQATHSPFGPDQPALQTQSVMESLAGGASEFRHGSQ